MLLTASAGFADHAKVVVRTPVVVHHRRHHRRHHKAVVVVRTRR
jgi:hypothetical protein